MTENVTWHPGAVTRLARRRATGGPGMTIWLTGLSGSGKSTVAADAERALVEAGRAAYTLDGDNVRHGLNADLGFTPADRSENVRRVGEVARLMADAGLVVLVPVISPYRDDRAAVRRAHDDAGIPFGEVHVATPIEECEKRDPKGLYARARAGEITGFTGIDDPYEEPLDPEAVVGAGMQNLAESVSTVLDLVESLASA
jgi:bifunctional enzyme CysN/CysC